MANSEGFTGVSIKPSTKERLIKKKGAFSYDQEINCMMDLKEKVESGQRVSSEDLKIVKEPRKRRLKE